MRTPPAGSASADTRPEIQLLIACARTSLDAATVATIHQLLARSIDWDYLIHLAGQHRVLPLLYRSLSTLGESVPPAVLRRLKEAFETIARHNLALTGELLRVVALYEAEGIRAIPYKGPAMATRAYKSLALREFRDLDIFLDIRDVERAKDLLLAQGYHVREGTVPRDVLFEQHYHYQLLHYERQVVVELHWAFTLGYWSFPIDTAALWERSQRLPLVRGTINAFSAEDILLILCVHGAKHIWSQLSWICDIHELVRAHPTLNWEQILAHARQLQSSRVLILGLQLAGEVLGTPLPEGVRARIEADPAARALAAQICGRLRAGEETPMEGIAARRFYFRLRENRRDKVHYSLFQARTYLMVLVTPHGRERSVLPSPRFVNVLYPAFRPIRVVVGLVSRMVAAVFERLRSDIV